MQTISLEAPAWLTTLPRRVAPQEEEWLPGLLLRCDEVNHWASRTTLAQMLRLGREQHSRRWLTTTPNLIVVPSGSMVLSSLAQALAISQEALLASTYHRELARLYEESNPSPALLNRSWVFHLCPACLAERRRLRRSLALPALTLCETHHLTLLRTCQCGSPLELFPRQTAPFTCRSCGLDWAQLPQIKATSERMLVEQRLLTWYSWFLTQGTPLTMRAARNVIARLEKKQQDLEGIRDRKEWSGKQSRRRMAEFVRHLYQEPASWQSASFATLVAALVKYDISLQELAVLAQPRVLREGSEP